MNSLSILISFRDFFFFLRRPNIFYTGKSQRPENRTTREKSGMHFHCVGKWWKTRRNSITGFRIRWRERLLPTLLDRTKRQISIKWFYRVGHQLLSNWIKWRDLLLENKSSSLTMPNVSAGKRNIPSKAVVEWHVAWSISRWNSTIPFRELPHCSQ